MKLEEMKELPQDIPQDVQNRFEIKEVSEPAATVRQIPETKDKAPPKIKSTKKKQKDEYAIPNRRPGKMPFEIGEVQNFEITYLGMVAGNFSMTVKPLKMLNDRQVYYFHASAQSSKMFNLFYRLDDYFESFWDYEGLFSYRFHMVLNQSRQSRDMLELYDSEKKQVYYWNRRKHIEKGYSENKEFKPIDRFPQDSISSAYWIRVIPYEVGKTYTFPMVAEGKNWEAVVTVVRKETVDTPLGKLNAFVLKPQTKFQGVMSQNRGDSFIWVSDDDKRYILRIEAKVKVGTVVAHLKSVTHE